MKLIVKTVFLENTEMQKDLMMLLEIVLLDISVKLNLHYKLQKQLMMLQETSVLALLVTIVPKEQQSQSNASLEVTILIRRSLYQQLVFSALEENIVLMLEEVQMEMIEMLDSSVFLVLLKEIHLVENVP